MNDNTITTEKLMEVQKAQEQSTIEKIRVLNNLLTSTVPRDMDALNQFREYTHYKSAFNNAQMTLIRDKIMELVKQL